MMRTARQHFEGLIYESEAWTYAQQPTLKEAVRGSAGKVLRRLSDVNRHLTMAASKSDSRIADSQRGQAPLPDLFFLTMLNPTE
jgi:hypothetical protein